MADTVVSDLLYAGLRIAGVTTGAGRAASPEQMADAFSSLNRMLSSWNVERSNIYTISISAYQLIGGQHVYTIPGDFDGPRPVNIDRAAVLLGDSPLRLPVKILTDQEWSQIKLQNLTGSFPTKLYADGSFPQCNLYVWPAPSMPCQLELYTWQAFAQLYAQDDPIRYPDGYEEAITYNLAMRLAAMFRTQLTPEAIAIAKDSLARIKSHNVPSPLMSCDPAIMPSARGGSFNWLTGDTV